MTLHYYNIELNTCGTREWVINYLFYGGMVESRAEAEKGLDTNPEFFGWTECHFME